MGKYSFSQDSIILPYEQYKNKIVLYSDFGFSTAPFSIKYPFNSNLDKIKYRNNYRSILGLGVSYKWFALRLSIALPGSDHSIAKYGKTTALNIGVDFTLKKVFWDIDLRNYQGYMIKNAYKWNSDYNKIHTNEIQPSITATSFSINAWYFHNKHFKMNAVKGKTAHFIKKVHTWYIKNTFNIYGVGNNSNSVIPVELNDTTNSKTRSNAFSAFDFGMIPGYAYADRINNWQFAGLFGFGAVVQDKFYTIDGYQRSVIGLAPRYDIKFIGGFSVPKYFLFLITDFDNKSIKFNDLKYQQTYYSIKLVGGVRLDNKDDRKKKRELRRLN